MAGAAGFEATATGIQAAFPHIDWRAYTLPGNLISGTTPVNEELITCFLVASAEFMTSYVCDDGCLDTHGAQERIYRQMIITIYRLHNHCNLKDDDPLSKKYNDTLKWLDNAKKCCEHINSRNRNTLSILCAYGGDGNRDLTEDTLDGYVNGGYSTFDPNTRRYN